MRRLSFLIFSLFIFIGMSSKAYAQQKQYVQMGAKILTLDGKKLLAISFKNDEKWHTYWKNPGDAGLSIKLKFKSGDQEINLADHPWPAPKRYIEAGNMWAYGYSNSYALFFDYDQKLNGKELKIDGKWLVCKDICIPGSKSISFKVSDSGAGENNSLVDDKQLSKIFKTLPRLNANPPVQLSLNYNKEKKKLALHYLIEDADFNEIKKSASILTPYVTIPLDYKHEEAYFDKKTKTLFGRIYIDWDGEYEEPSWPLPKDGVFKRPLKVRYLLQYPQSKPASIIEYSFSKFNFEGDDALSKVFEKATPLLGMGAKIENKVEKENKKESKTLFYYLIFAFIGGLILNLMPCVLPVISLKLFALISHKNESKGNILKHNLAYTAGVLFSFMLLGLAVYLLKTSGEQIGWGFQLQSPLFVFIMLIIIFVMSLNMLGLFEFKTPGGKLFGGLKVENSFIGDFVNGILATILSTPCSAPFLGTALTFAFTTSSLNIFLIFIFVGLGLSFPFILTGFFPSLIKFLPKPGMWMEKLKYFLGITLVLTSLWLLDVLSSLIDYSTFGIYIHTILALTFFAFFFRQKITKSLFWNIVFFILPLFLLFNFTQNDGFKVSENKSQKSSSSLSWERWSPKTMSSLKNEKKLVFINFTANWCLTCKVNKKLVLETDDFKALVAQENITLLEGDWTKRDDEITRFLKSYDLIGVPAYFIQKPNGDIVPLGETISLSKIKKSLE